MFSIKCNSFYFYVPHQSAAIYNNLLMLSTYGVVRWRILFFLYVLDWICSLDIEIIPCFIQVFIHIEYGVLCCCSSSIPIYLLSFVNLLEIGVCTIIIDWCFFVCFLENEDLMNMCGCHEIHGIKIIITIVTIKEEEFPFFFDIIHTCVNSVVELNHTSWSIYMDGVV